MTATSYHASVKDVQASSLAPRGPFARREWFSLLEGSEASPLYAETDDASGAVVFPLRRVGRRLESLVNWYAFTWQPLATAYASLDGLTITLARDLADKTSHVVLDRVPDEDGCARQLERAFQRAGWLVLREPCDTNRFLSVAGRSYAEYLASRPGPVRTTLKRKAKTVDVEIVSSFNEDIWHSYEEIYTESWKPEEGDPTMLRAFAEAEGAAGRIRLAVARHHPHRRAARTRDRRRRRRFGRLRHRGRRLQARLDGGGSPALPPAMLAQARSAQLAGHRESAPAHACLAPWRRLTHARFQEGTRE